MTKETVIAIRKILVDENPNVKFTVIADNVIYFRESLVQLVWDDDKEILWALRQNQETRENYMRPVQIQCCSYEVIQYISADFPTEMGKRIAKDVGFDPDKSEAFIDNLDLRKNPPL